MQPNQPRLFDLLLDESSRWEALATERQLQAIEILARLIASATMNDHEEDEDD